MLGTDHGGHYLKMCQRISKDEKTSTLRVETSFGFSTRTFRVDRPLYRAALWVTFFIFFKHSHMTPHWKDNFMQIPKNVTTRV